MIGIEPGPMYHMGLAYYWQVCGRVVRVRGGGGRVRGWMTNHLKSKYVPETLSFSNIYSERSFSSCKFFFDRRTDRPTDRQTDRQTDGPTNLLIEAPFPELKNLKRNLGLLF